MTSQILNLQDNFQSADILQETMGNSIGLITTLHLGEIEVPNNINGTINVSEPNTIDSFNHAWVLAEVSPN